MNSKNDVYLSFDKDCSELNASNLTALNDKDNSINLDVMFHGSASNFGIYSENMNDRCDKDKSHNYN